MNKSERIELCNSALEKFNGVVAPDIYSEIYDYINKYNEWGVGIELLIDTVCEEETLITPIQYEKVKLAMASMGLGDSERLSSLIKCVKST